MKKFMIVAGIMCMGVGVYAAGFDDLLLKAAESKAPVLNSADVPVVSKGYSDPVELARTIEWVTIPGGTFQMGTTDMGQEFLNAKPVHQVTVKTFQMSKTHVTVAQYAECVSKGACTVPDIGKYCNWGVSGRENHPVTCVDWNQANQYAKFKGARLPTEAEWEYAATSGGKNQKYPWGNEKPTCERAIMFGRDDGFFGFLSTYFGCGKDSTWPVCSKPLGNTEQGLCDMAGNASQLVQDRYHSSYDGSPDDGSAFDTTAGNNFDYYRLTRGGTFLDQKDLLLRSEHRTVISPNERYSGVSFRLAR